MIYVVALIILAAVLLHDQLADPNSGLRKILRQQNA